jgi:uncharacterized protein
MPSGAEEMPERSFTSGAARPTVRDEGHASITARGAVNDTARGQQDDSRPIRRALQSGDEQAIRSFFAEGATWTLRAADTPISGTWTGREAIIDGFFATAMAHREPGSVRIEVTAMIAEQDQVVLQWTSRARMSDGEPYENDCIGVFTVRDGKIQAVREYMDTLYACDAFSRAGSSHSAVGGGV